MFYSKRRDGPGNRPPRLLFAPKKKEIAPQAAVGWPQLAPGQGETAREQRQDLAAQAHMIDAHPGPKPGGRRVVKIHHGKKSARSQMLPGRFHGSLETGIEHGQGIGKDDEVEGSRVNKKAAAPDAP